MVVVISTAARATESEQRWTSDYSVGRPSTPAGHSSKRDSPAHPCRQVPRAVKLRPDARLERRYAMRQLVPECAGLHRGSGAKPMIFREFGGPAIRSRAVVARRASGTKDAIYRSEEMPRSRKHPPGPTRSRELSTTSHGKAGVRNGEMIQIRASWNDDPPGRPLATRRSLRPGRMLSRRGPAPSGETA
jgi:hypothetical protein